MLATTAADPAAYVALPMRWKVSGESTIYERLVQMLSTIKDSINRLIVGENRSSEHGRCEQGKLDHYRCFDLCHCEAWNKDSNFF